VKWLYETLAFCPRCGARYPAGAFDPVDVRFVCEGCGYEFFQNSTPSCVAVVPQAGAPSNVLLLTRSTAPAIGKLGLPGGFMRHAEPPRDAVCREVREETSLQITIDRPLGETMVVYPYCGAVVSVLEMAFVAHPVEVDLTGVATGEASSIGYCDASAIVADARELAFPEHRLVLERYLQSLSRG
jgi:ADP-ribose pyrophosphatase YjhB (NUDIX family)